MTRFTRQKLTCLWFLLMISSAAVALAQQNSRQEPSTEQGTVVTASRATLLIRTDAGEYKLFELTSDTTRPKEMTPGSAVKVTFTPLQTGAQTGAPLVTLVEVTTVAAKGTKPPPKDTIPPSMRRLEGSMKRQASRYHVGLQAGAALDPEQILIGVQGQFGPIFNSNTFARPNMEFLFGEVTDIVAINLEGIYRLPGTLRGSRWQFYFGAGPAFNFVNKGFTNEEGGEDFSFDDFTFDAALNILAGVQSKGMFMELKATAYGEPSIRFILGYSF